MKLRRSSLVLCWKPLTGCRVSWFPLWRWASSVRFGADRVSARFLRWRRWEGQSEQTAAPQALFLGLAPDWRRFPGQQVVRLGLCPNFRSLAEAFSHAMLTRCGAFGCEGGRFAAVWLFLRADAHCWSDLSLYQQPERFSPTPQNRPSNNICYYWWSLSAVFRLISHICVLASNGTILHVFGRGSWGQFVLCYRTGKWCHDS